MYQEVEQHTLSCLGTSFFCKHFFQNKSWEESPIGFASLTLPTNLLYILYQEVEQHTLSCLGTSFFCKHFFQNKSWEESPIGFASLTLPTNLLYILYQEVEQYTLSCIGIIITSWYTTYIRQTMSHHRRWGDISRSICHSFTNSFLIKICTKKYQAQP